ncbi:predicted protein, partial [Nematostella vectensis]
ITLVCKARGLPKPSVSWTRAGDKLSHWLASMGRVSTSNGNVTITQAEPNDAGMYLCTARNLLGVASARSTLYFKGMFHPFDVITLLSSNVEVTCPVRGFPLPSITWLKDGQPLKQSMTVKVNNLTGTLYLLSILERRAGLYMCVATNSLGAATATTTLNVLHYDSLSHALTIGDNLNTLISTSVSIHCNATGNPVPSITWSRSGALIEPSKRIKIMGSTLVIVGTLWSDTGSYECVASNGAGTDRKSSFLKFVRK